MDRQSITNRFYAIQVLILGAVGLTTISGCEAPRRLYDGPGRPQEEVAVLEVTRPGAVLSIDGVDLKAKPFWVSGEDGVFPWGQSDSFELLPGKHLIKAQYAYGEMVEVREQTDIDKWLAQAPSRRYSVQRWIVSKDVEFTMEVGRGDRYGLTGAPRLEPLPIKGILPNRGEVVDLKLIDLRTNKVIQSWEETVRLCDTVAQEKQPR
jgi:hypothetical protein